MDFLKCDKCKKLTNHTIEGLNHRAFNICDDCDSALLQLLEALPFTAEEVMPDSDNWVICTVVVNAFFAEVQS